MRFLDEHGGLHPLPPTTKAAKLWMLGLEWQSVEKGSWADTARGIGEYKTVGGAIALKGNKRPESPKATMHVGVWALSFTEEEEYQLKLPSNCYSLAAVFALAAQGQGLSRAALYLDLGVIEGVNQAYFCRLFNGVPVTDAVFPKDKATALAQDALGEGDTVFGNDQDLLTKSTPIDLKWFSSATDKHSLISKVPFNWLMVAIALVVVVGVAVSIVGYQKYKEKQRLAELARIEAENDPVPKYQEALAVQRLHVGMDRAGLGKLYSDIMGSVKEIRSGKGLDWKLIQIDCTLVACTSTLQRTSGTFSDIKRDRASDILLVPTVDDQGRLAVTSLLTTKTTLAVKPTVADLPTDLPRYDAYVLSTGNTLQRWANSGIPVQSIGLANTWPDTPGARELQMPGMVGRGDFELKGVNAVFGKELISQLPPSIRIRGIVVRIGSDSMTLDLTGNFYVKK